MLTEDAVFIEGYRSPWIQFSMYKSLQLHNFFCHSNNCPPTIFSLLNAYAQLVDFFYFRVIKIWCKSCSRAQPISYWFVRILCALSPGTWFGQVWFSFEYYCLVLFMQLLVILAWTYTNPAHFLYHQPTLVGFISQQL